MSSFDETTVAHIRKSVVMHEFIDSMDWCLGLDQLSCLDDSDIDALVTDPARRLPLGVTTEIARRDRELFDREAGRTGEAL